MNPLPKIRKGVPMPKLYEPSAPKVAYLKALKPDESFHVSTLKLCYSWYRIAKRAGIKITTSKEPGGYGVWRV